MIYEDTFWDTEMYRSGDDEDEGEEDLEEAGDDSAPDELSFWDKKMQGGKRGDHPDLSWRGEGSRKYHKKEAKTRYLRKHRDDFDS